MSDRSSNRSLPPTIWALGVVSLLMDTSSELIHSLLPVFLAATLGASPLAIGVIEGVAESTASMTKLVSGTLSDRFRRRKPLVMGGYGLAAASKVLFPLATSVSWVLTARFLDRLGKGLRGAPRDALLADVTPAAMRGAAYGLRQALDSAGAILGPALAMLLMAALSGEIRLVLWVAVVPALLSVSTLAIGVEESPASHRSRPAARLTAASVTLLPRRYWLIVGVAGVFTLARFSEAFLVLRGADLGLTAGQAPLVMVVMNLFYAGAAYPAGRAADRMRARDLLLGGLGALIVADLILAGATGSTAVLLGAACWGLHLALTQGLWAKLVADAAPDGLRGSAFGVFNLVTGIALLAASAFAGWIWHAAGPSATFLASAACAAIAFGGIAARAGQRAEGKGQR